MSNHTTSPLRPALLASILLGLAAQAQAAHPLVTDDTGTQGAGHWQFEANTDHTRIRGGGATDWEREVNIALTRGVSETLDVAVNVPWLHLGPSGAPSQRGVGDATLLAKWRFHDNGQGWTLGLRPEITVPTGSDSRGLGNGRAAAALTLLSHYQSGPWTWLANAGYAHNDNTFGDRKHLWAASTAVLYELSEQWTLAADIGVGRAAEQGATAEKFGLLGAIYHIGEDTDLDVGWRRSWAGGSAAHTLGAGLTLRW
jgi:hypothetical protein